jgi:hypothetical protein
MGHHYGYSLPPAENMLMQTYTSAMYFDVNLNPHVAHRNLYLDVDYQVDNSQVTVKSVHSFGRDVSSDLSKDNCLAIAQQIEDSLEFGY